MEFLTKFVHLDSSSDRLAIDHMRADCSDPKETREMMQPGTQELQFEERRREADASKCVDKKKQVKAIQEGN